MNNNTHIYMDITTAYFYLAITDPHRFLAVCEEFGVPPEALKAVYFLKSFADEQQEKQDEH